MATSRPHRSLSPCVLLDKSKPRRDPVTVDYVGFTIPDVWVVGYGLDDADRLRSLPYLGTVEPPVRR